MKYILGLMLLTSTLSAQAQKGLISRLFSNEKDTTRKASFLPVPVIGYGQEKGFEFGLGFIYSYFMDRKDTLNRSSNISGTATYSTKKTYNFSLKGDFWTPANRYHLIGELRYKKMPFNFYGTGNATLASSSDRLVQNQFKILLEAEKALGSGWYTGISAGFEDYRYEDPIAGGIYTTGNYVDKAGGQVAFIGLSQVYDTRNSNNYATRGFFGRITWQYSPGIDSHFKGSQVKANMRGYISLSKQFTLAAQGYYHTLQGTNTPFYLLPQLGNDELMRGYYTGRYRDENLVAAQAELRFRYNNRFGAVLFTGTGSVFGEQAFSLQDLKPNYGGGLRYFFDPAKGLSIRLDYGIGEKRPGEQRQTGFYIGLGEAF